MMATFLSRTSTLRFTAGPLGSGTGELLGLQFNRCELCNARFYFNLQVRFFFGQVPALEQVGPRFNVAEHLLIVLSSLRSDRAK